MIFREPWSLRTHSANGKKLTFDPQPEPQQSRNRTGTDYTIFDDTITTVNSYHGSVYQEAVSSVTQTPDSNFPTTNNQFVTYGVEYLPDWDLNGGGYTRWYVNGKASGEVTGSALPPVKALDIGQRHIPVEPMSIIMNLGMSPGFQTLDFDEGGMTFPAQLKFDYVRVYQPASQSPKTSCDPPDYPTADYINRHIELYTNPNITRFPTAFPLNKLTAKAAGASC